MIFHAEEAHSWNVVHSRGTWNAMKVGSGIPSHAEKEFCGELNPCVTKMFPSRICISSNLMLYATSWKVWLEREEYAFLIQVFFWFTFRNMSGQSCMFLYIEFWPICWYLCSHFVILFGPICHSFLSLGWAVWSNNLSYSKEESQQRIFENHSSSASSDKLIWGGMCLHVLSSLSCQLMSLLFIVWDTCSKLMPVP